MKICKPISLMYKISSMDFFGLELIANYTDSFASIFKSIKIKKFEILGLKILFDETEQQSIDDRIKKIEVAKKNLEESLVALGELQTEAENNKKEIDKTNEIIANLSRDKEKLSTDLSEIQKLTSVNITTFQRLAGVPSQSSLKRERIIAFFSGVVASIIASFIYLGIDKLYVSYSEQFFKSLYELPDKFKHIF